MFEIRKKLIKQDMNINEFIDKLKKCDIIILVKSVTHKLEED